MTENKNVRYILANQPNYFLCRSVGLPSARSVKVGALLLQVQTSKLRKTLRNFG